jgi:large subunit ribosomal protein L21
MVAAGELPSLVPSLVPVYLYGLISGHLSSLAGFMYAIFRAAGKQFKAEKGKTLRLPLMSAEAGSKVTFDEVLLSSDGNTINAGTPLVKGAKVLAEVVGEGKEPKIYVFKFKRRKNYRRKTGHRQGYTEVRITDVKLG